MEVIEQKHLTDGRNYNAVDLAKFICSILVMTVHIYPFGFSDETGPIRYMNDLFENYLSRIAVPFFFVCSGFFLYKKTTLPSFHFGPTKKYALRLLRLYFVWTLIYFPLAYKEFPIDEKGMAYAILTYVKRCVFTGSYTHLWYLNAAIFAVLLISLLLYKKVSPPKMMGAALILYIIGLFAQSWFGFIAPLRESAPVLWSMLKLVERIIETTRNGLFEGFLFVGFGMLFAYYRFPISRKMSLFGFIFSMILMFAEFSLLEHFGFAREHDMYLFLVPASFFGFSLVYQIELPDRPIYKTLRTLNSLIFYSNLWVRSAVGKTLKMIYEPLPRTCLLFILTLAVTVTGSLIVMKLADLRGFRWLKKMYT